MSAATAESRARALDHRVDRVFADIEKQNGRIKNLERAEKERERHKEWIDSRAICRATARKRFWGNIKSWLAFFGVLGVGYVLGLLYDLINETLR